MKIWRLIVHDPQIASLREIEEFWSLSDVYDANEVLDLQEEHIRILKARLGQ